MPPRIADKLTLAFVIMLALTALALATLAPGFGVDNTLVYQGF